MRNQDTDNSDIDVVGQRTFEFHNDAFQALVPSQLYDMGQWPDYPSVRDVILKVMDSILYLPVIHGLYTHNGVASVMLNTTN